MLDFIKSEVAVTNASGVVNVIFIRQLPFDLHYVVLLTCKDPSSPVIAYPSNETLTGFTITTMLAKDGAGYLPVANVTVYWLVIPQTNE